MIMKQILFIGSLLAIVGLVSCDKDDNCTPEKIHSTWTLGKEITSEYDTILQRDFFRIVDGENRLFEYNRIDAQCDDVSDDEGGERLYFELDEQTADFSAVDEEILNLKCVYELFGAWVPFSPYQIKKGTIEGRKLSNSEWEIDAVVTTTPMNVDDEPKTIQFSEIFRE